MTSPVNEWGFSFDPSWTEEDAEAFKARFLEAASKPAEWLAPPPDVCYSRRMDNEMIQILKAKVEAVSSLAKALSNAVDHGSTNTAEEAACFVTDWLSAMESMIPQSDKD